VGRQEARNTLNSAGSNLKSDRKIGESATAATVRRYIAASDAKAGLLKSNLVL
jgi:hypothetical protein